MERIKRMLNAVIDRVKVVTFIIIFTLIMLLLAKWAALCYYTALF